MNMGINGFLQYGQKNIIGYLAIFKGEVLAWFLLAF